MHQLQNECILTMNRNSVIMSNTQIQHFIAEVENLCEDDKIQVISIIQDSLRTSSRKSMDDKLAMSLFDKFSGSIKADTQVDCRNAMDEYLDERFGA